ncbi:PDZ domain-containing RING finger protein 4 [Galemys pyrenaicus]|uniref:PDZ domain-containing RING finger protein 4 n=1 Tax=Galemys pyrenaicus TaxID=202257 RepID=A0A8J6AV18_GALPY|nr:PDZ domain-containing RING finger protein 4 [Galemys pyrenaicus]
MPTLECSQHCSSGVMTLPIYARVQLRCAHLRMPTLECSQHRRCAKVALRPIPNGKMPGMQKGKDVVPNLELGSRASIVVELKVVSQPQALRVTGCPGGMPELHRAGKGEHSVPKGRGAGALPRAARGRQGNSRKVNSALRAPFPHPAPTMGFALERFAEAVDPDFECKLCGQVLEEPLCTPCGHVFCASCLLPWAARRRRCPLQCQPLAPGELYPVLPLRSLIQKLRIQCDYRARGCSLSVRLHELAAHVERCDFGPGPRHQGCASGPGDCHREVVPAWEGSEAAPGDCPGAGAGGGLPGGGGSRRGPGPGVLAWRRREKALLAQLWELQGEVQLTARRYQEKFTQYMAHVRNFARDLGGGHGRGGEHKPFTVVLERENDTLGFNIIGGRPNQINQEKTLTEGIYVSKILANGPADRADGLEIHDKIIEAQLCTLTHAHTHAPGVHKQAQVPHSTVPTPPASTPTRLQVTDTEVMNISQGQSEPGVLIQHALLQRDSLDNGGADREENREAAAGGRSGLKKQYA